MDRLEQLIKFFKAKNYPAWLAEILAKEVYEEETYLALEDSDLDLHNND